MITQLIRYGFLFSVKCVQNSDADFDLTKGSFVLVLDRTPNMANQLQTIKSNVEEWLFDLVNMHPRRFYNFILVTFGDPGLLFYKLVHSF